MKKIIIILAMVVCFSTALNSKITQYSYYGEYMTPQDTLRGLVIFVSFGAEADSIRVNDWNDVFPDWAMNKKAYYSNISDFDLPISATDSHNISRWYYEMSKNSTRPFKLMFDTIKVNLNLDSIPDTTDYSSINDEVIKQMKKDRPSFDWSKYDNRTNNNWEFDNSINTIHTISMSDSIVDWLCIVYRFKDDSFYSISNWPETLRFPVNAAGNAGHSVSISYNGYTFGLGFKQWKAETNHFALFIHEIGHANFEFGHYGGANNASGNYFHIPASGWGVMNATRSTPFRTDNSFERWYTGWNNIKCYNNTNSKVTYPLSSDTLVFYLRDFATTGDMVCVELPADTLGNKQRLWIEYHTMNNIYDNRERGAMYFF